MPHATLYIILGITFGLLMAWGIGANDVANAMGMSVGSKALTIRQALIIAAIFEAAGAMLAGGQVTDTIRKGLIDSQAFSHDPRIFILGMLAALLAAGTWLLLASYKGWPVSTTHSIVGAILGFGMLTLGLHAINWFVVLNIVLSWIVTPVLSGIIAYFVCMSMQWLIFDTENPLHSAKTRVPAYIFLVALVISLVTFLKGMKHLHLHLTSTDAVLFSISFALLTAFIGGLIIRRLDFSMTDDSDFQFAKVEKIFAVLMVFTACAMAFAHGSNDVANAIGPLAAVINVSQSGAIGAQVALPYWVLILGAVGIVAGLGMYGYRVIATVGHEITALTPSRGFAAELATATTVVLASGLGLPVSTTQTLVGAVLGVGMTRRIAALNLGVVRNIFMSWVITLPAAVVLAIVYYNLLLIILP